MSFQAPSLINPFIFKSLFFQIFLSHPLRERERERRRERRERGRERGRGRERERERMKSLGTKDVVRVRMINFSPFV